MTLPLWLRLELRLEDLSKPEHESDVSQPAD